MGCGSGDDDDQDHQQDQVLIQTRYDGEPWNFTGRIVIFGCLNDLTKWPDTKDEPWKWKYAAVAEKFDII